MSTNLTRIALLAALGFALGAPAAWAHALLDRTETVPNGAYRGVVRIMHGCDGEPTTRVTVTIPDGVFGAKPMPIPGWEVTTVRGAYKKNYPSFHGSVSEGVKTITWSGGTLADDQVDEFTFFARVSDDFAPGTIVYFPVEQDCAKGTLRWVEIPAAGQDARGLKSPAPGVRIAGAERAAARTGAAEVRAGDVAIRAPWIRATPGGAKVAGGYVTLTNAGGQVDRLVGAAIPQAGRGEIHYMSTDGGIMRMAPVEGGLAIEPDRTVELKPGGFHLMFLDLKVGLKAGETVAGTLTFERAGTVPVTFSVAPIGAAGHPDGAGDAAGGAHHHH